MGWLDWLSAAISGGAAIVPVQESGLPLLDYEDPDINLSGNQAAANWRRLTQSSADLSPLTHERQQQIALHLSDRNPLAKGVVDLLTAFVVGEGFKVTSKDDDVQKTVDRFWEDGQNDMAERVEDFTRELSIYGEQIVLAFVNEASGRVALVSADPRTATKIVPHPLASDRPYAICFGSATAASKDRWVKIIVEDDDPQSATFGRLVGQKDGEQITLGSESHPFYQPPNQELGSVLAGCFFFAVNKPRAAMRGRSDLLSVADFMDLYDRLIFDEAERMSFLRAFVWDVEVTGADEQKLRDKAAAEPPPKPGSVKYHNESEKWTALSPDLNSDDSQNTADLILSLVATGVGLPKVWLNGLMDANRATAQESGEPALKRLQARQRTVSRAITRMVRFALDQAELAGTLAEAADARHQFTVDVPEMSSRDLEKASRALYSTIQAIGLAATGKLIDAETSQQVLAVMVAQLSIVIDLAELKLRLEAEAEKAEEEARNAPENQMPPQALPGGEQQPAQEQQPGRAA